MIYVLSMTRSLILVIALDLVKYICFFGNRRFDLLHNSCVAGSSALTNTMHKNDLNPKFANLINVITRKKMSKIEKNFFNVMA